MVDIVGTGWRGCIVVPTTVHATCRVSARFMKVLATIGAHRGIASALRSHMPKPLAVIATGGLRDIKTDIKSIGVAHSPIHKGGRAQ